MKTNQHAHDAMAIHLGRIFDALPPMPTFAPDVRRAPKRQLTLARQEILLALKNALRYIPAEWHEALAPEFLQELLTRGRIYGYRFMPPGAITGRPITEYRGQCLEGRAF